MMDKENLDLKWIPDTSTGWLPIGSIVGWKRNPNRHPPAQVAQLAASFRRFGFIDAVTIARIQDEGVLELRAGHGRIEGLSAILKEDPDFIPAGAPGPGLVRALIYDFPTRAAADAYGLADNRLAEIAEPDDDAIAALLRELDGAGFSLDGLGWQDGELEALLKATLPEPDAEPKPAAGGSPPTDDLPAEVPAITKPGEVITLGRHTLHCASCIEVANGLAENSVDAIVGDAPYGLSPDGRARTWDEVAALRREGKGPRGGFMGKEWDSGVPGPEWAQAMFRILKPGGHLVVFCGTRTDHRMICALEDAGFEIRDKLVWLHYQGFPKSHDVSKAIDEAAGAEREVIGIKKAGMGSGKTFGMLQNEGRNDGAAKAVNITTPATPEAKRWSGWGTALKPAIEPAVLCRKPLSEGTVAANVLRWGTGALNIDGCRYPEGDTAWPGPSGEVQDMTAQPRGGSTGIGAVMIGQENNPPHPFGRFPANVYHCPKPASGERERGMEDSPKQRKAQRQGALGKATDPVSARFLSAPTANIHPTVKPVRLMTWIVRLITPPGGRLFAPFVGSGTDLLAGEAVGVVVEGCELEPAYCDIARARFTGWAGGA